MSTTSRLNDLSGSCYTDSGWSTKAASKQSNQANRANGEGYSADQGGEKKSRNGKALKQIPEFTRGCRIVGDSRENIVQSDEESDNEYRCAEGEPELPCVYARGGRLAGATPLRFRLPIGSTLYVISNSTPGIANWGLFQYQMII